MNKSNPNITTTGPLSFNPSMHGSSSIASSSSHPPYDPATLQQKLTQKLGPEYISTRPGPGGGPKLTYAEGWKIINLANEVFGFDGWSSSIVTMSTDFMDFDETTRRYSIGITAVVRVTLVASGSFHEDVGYGTIENTKSRGQGLDKVCSLFLLILLPSWSSSARKRPSRMVSSVLSEILEISWATACMIKDMPKKSPRLKSSRYGKPVRDDLYIHADEAAA